MIGFTRSLDLFEDGIGWGRPVDGERAQVAFADEAVDFADQLPDVF
jgi:hypothetical protein